MMKTKSALSYFGSDSEVAEQIAKLLNHAKHVTIPFCGGMAILPHLTAKAVVANDLNALAITFYRVLSGVFGETSKRALIERCQHTLSHPSEIKMAASMIVPGVVMDSAQTAWAYWALCWIGRKGSGGTKSVGGNPSVRRKADGGNNATRIRAAADDLEAWAKHFERCEWEQTTFHELIPKVPDVATVAIYCDPPWIGAGGNYLHTFTDIDHAALQDLLSRFKETTVVVRYGDHPFVRSLYSEGWTIIEASSRTQSNKVKGELWITNKPEIAE